MLFRSQLVDIEHRMSMSTATASLVWMSEAGGGSPDEARLEQTPYPFQRH